MLALYLSVSVRALTPAGAGWEVGVVAMFLAVEKIPGIAEAQECVIADYNEEAFPLIVRRRDGAYRSLGPEWLPVLFRHLGKIRLVRGDQEVLGLFVELQQSTAQLAVASGDGVPLALAG